ncbi:hypothetical protein JXL83_10170 [candidate division WOR-3 bacterium]|nr:hypothetical protein [candidate division WOR-3 bacterium]
MIIHTDKEYRETKLIMLGRKEIKPEFKSLAKWIDDNFCVKTINIFFDTIDDGTRPRLGIFFECTEEADSFHENGRFSNYDSIKQKRIADKFRQTLENTGLIVDLNNPETVKYSTDNVLVYTSAFRPIAMAEANENIPQEKIEELKRRIDNKDLWEISRSFSRVTFFLFTDEHVKKYTNTESVKKWKDKYYELLTRYDEFGYFKRENFSIDLDSKENFDKNFQSNWYYYYK